MSCKYNNCKHCGYKSECEIHKEIAELKNEVDLWKNASENNSYKAFQFEKENAELTEELTKKADTNHSLVEQMADLESENAELKRIVRMVAMINKDIYTEEGIKAIYAEAEQFIKEN